MKLNPAIREIRESATLAINQRVNILRQSGRTIWHFGFGQSPFPVHPKMQEALRQNAFRKEYLPTLGLPALREAICSFHREHFQYEFAPDRVIIGPGSKELIFQALYLLEGPLILPAPCWVSYAPQGEICGKPVVPVIAGKTDGYKVRAKQLRAAGRELPAGQKVMILNSPNNPTGVVYSADELESLAQVCRELNIIVISDEIYSHVCFNGTPAKGIGSFYPEGTIVTGGLSKAFSAGGYRLGFLAAPAEMTGFIEAFVTLASETFSCVSSPIQYAAVVAFSDDSDVMEYIDQCTLLHNAAGDYLYERFTEMSLGCIRPEGGFYLFPDFAPFRRPLEGLGIAGSPDLCEYLLENVGVAMLPGTDFCHPAEELTCRVTSVDYDGGAVHEASLAQPQLDRAFIETHCPNLKNGCDALKKFLESL